MSCLLVFVLLSAFSCSDFVLDFCSRRSLGSNSSRAPVPSCSRVLVLGSSGAPVPAVPLLSQGGGDVFATVVFSCEVFFVFYEEEDSRVSDFWFHLFASVFLFFCSYWRVSLSTFRTSSYIDPPSTSC